MRSTLSIVRTSRVTDVLIGRDPLVATKTILPTTPIRLGFHRFFQMGFIIAVKSLLLQTVNAVLGHFNT